MSQSGKKTGRRLNRQCHPKADVYDVTLNDFANASLINNTSRLRKKVLNKLSSEVKELTHIKDDRSLEKKLDELELKAKDDQYIVSEVKKSSASKKKPVEEVVNDETGHCYPIEIWFMISDFIRPEDVGKFAAICKGCLAVTSTVEFWFNLYKRYYRKVDDLPERLRPECMVRRYRLRADVIRALHIMYPPFVNKLKPQVIFDGDPHVLIKRICILSWSEKKKNEWIFYFKLQQPPPIRYGRGGSENITKPSLLEMLGDINANPDDNCKVLQVTCLNYIPLPMITGQALRTVSLTLSQGLTYHRLQLSFGSDLSPYMSNNLVVLDPVLNVRVFDWWHPSFPHSDGLSHTFYTNESEDCPFDELEF